MYWHLLWDSINFIYFANILQELVASGVKSVNTEKLNFELEKFLELIPDEPKSIV